MKTIKLLHIRSSYSYGGPERQITYLTNSLAEQGISSGVATFAPRETLRRNHYYAKLCELGITAHRIDISGSFDFSCLQTLETLIAQEEYTVLVGHDYRADYFVTRLARSCHLPAISFSRGWTRHTLKVRFYEWLDYRFLKRMNGVVAVSQAKLQELTDRGVAADRLIYIPNSIMIESIATRTDVIRNRFSIPRDVFLVGTAGRLSVEKNQDVLIRAARRLLEKDPSLPVWFLIAGEGPRRKALEEVITPRFRDRIILAGWIDDNDDFYADIDLFALTSDREGFPNVLLEAGKYNLPVISTPAGGVPEIIADDESGRLTPFGDSDRLAEIILELHADRAKRQALGEKLGALTRERYDARLNAARFLEFVTGIQDRYEKA